MMTVLEQRYMETYIRRAQTQEQNENKLIKLLTQINEKLEKMAAASPAE